MGIYFKSWRRKIGVVTLVLACVFAGGLIRSTIIHDDLSYPTGPRSCQIITSFDCHLALLIWRDVRPTVRPEHLKWYTETPELTFHKFYNDSKKWNWQFCGLAAGKTTTPMEVMTFVVSYWFIVIPLMLVSAWLLLSKPRRPKSKSSSEPVSEQSV